MRRNDGYHHHTTADSPLHALEKVVDALRERYPEGTQSDVEFYLIQELPESIDGELKPGEEGLVRVMMAQDGNWNKPIHRGDVKLIYRKRGTDFSDPRRGTQYTVDVFFNRSKEESFDPPTEARYFTKNSP